ncbi:MAG: DASH family cryptochrome [Halothiobacillaceae bacterium]
MTLNIHWFRNDLRVDDNPALNEAARDATALLPLYLHDPRQDETTPWGFARRRSHRQIALRRALDELDQELRARGSRLIELQGKPEAVLPRLVSALNATRLVAERIAAPEEEAVDAALVAAGVPLALHWQSTLLMPEHLPFAIPALPDVFSAFRRAVEKCGLPVRSAVQAQRCLPPLPPAWAQFVRPFACRAVAPGDLPPVPPTGTISGREHLNRYLASDRPARYKQTRNGLMGKNYSTRLSVFLALGALSPVQVHEALCLHEDRQGVSEGSTWIRFELLWRDYFRFLHRQHGRRLYQARGLSERPEPAHDPAAFRRWCAGATGEPFVDAGMRELHVTGFLSNRMRQNVASYLVNDLGCDWRAGAAWFEACLIDYDVYSNQGNWLYLAGRGTDPRGQRRFDPQRQAGMYDPMGEYRKLWGGAPAIRPW